MIHAPSSVESPRTARRRPGTPLRALVVTPSLIGVGAYARLIRDDCVRELSTGVAAPPVLACLPHVRAASVAHLVPARGALTGVSALWVHGWAANGPLPAAITVAARPGVRLSEPAGTLAAWRAVTHEGSVEHAEAIGGTAVAHPAGAVATALAHDSLRHAIPAAWWALDALGVRPRDIEALLPRRGPCTRRAWSAWRAVRNARSGTYEPS